MQISSLELIFQVEQEKPGSDAEPQVGYLPKDFNHTSWIPKNFETNWNLIGTYEYLFQAYEN